MRWDGMGIAALYRQTEGAHSAKYDELLVFCVMFYFKQKSLMPNVLKFPSHFSPVYIRISPLHIHVCVPFSLSYS